MPEYCLPCQLLPHCLEFRIVKIDSVPCQEGAAQGDGIEHAVVEPVIVLEEGLSA